MFVDLTMWELQCEFKVEFVPTAAIQAAGGAGFKLAINVGKKKKLIADKVVLFQCKRR